MSGCSTVDPQNFYLQSEEAIETNSCVHFDNL